MGKEHTEPVAAGAAAVPRSRRPRDRYGLPLTTTPEAGACYVAALDRILHVQSGAEDDVRAALSLDPGFALGHAVLALLGAEWSVAVDTEDALRRAEAAAGRADERERRFIEVAAARVRDPGPGSAAALLNYLQAYPDDALAVSLAVPTIAFGGATEFPAEAWALVESVSPAYAADDWWFGGLLAFTRQDQGRFAEADELASRVLAREPASGHAVHAKTHVHYETGDHRAGLRWLGSWIGTSGARACHLAHFSWHAALHELAMGEDRAVACRYAAELAPPRVCGVRAVVDSASLLWRARIVGAGELGDIQEVVATVSPELLAEPETAFLALHAAVALAAAGDLAGLARLQRHAAGRAEPVFTETVVGLCQALEDLVGGDARSAVRTLLGLTGVERLGGSLAQREVIEDTLIYAASQAGEVELACTMLAARLDRRESPRDRRRHRDLVRQELSG